MSETNEFYVFVTKYALTAGIQKHRVRRSSISSDMVVAVEAEYHTSYHGKEWHHTRAQAVAQAEAMKAKKVASLKKQIDKISALQFAATEPSA